MPTMTPATTTTMTPLRICLRRFCRWASAASRASLAARWRALLSLGTARDPTQSPGAASDRPPEACGRQGDPGREDGRRAAIGPVRSR